MIVELTAVERIVELHGALHFRDDSRWTLHAFVFTVEFVDQLQPLGVIHIDLAYRLLLLLLLLWKQLSCHYGAECRYRGYEERSYEDALLT